MNDYNQHLSNYLTERGFETVLAGQQHEVAKDIVEGSAAKKVLGYDHVIDGNPSDVRDLPIDHKHTHRDFAITEAATDYIHQQGRDKITTPFFLSIGLDNTHQPLPTEQDLINPEYVEPPNPLPDIPPIRKEMAAYHLVVQYVDECVGMVLDALEETNQLSNTLFLFTTDHGIPFPRMKCTLSDDGTGVSLIARFPEKTQISRGVAKDALVSQIDLFPTFCDILDLDIPGWVEGKSLLPLLQGKVDAVHNAIFSEVTYHAAYEPKRCIRTRRYKYIRRFDNEYQKRVAPNTDHGPSKDFFIDLGYYDQYPPQEALYDLYLDPNEQNNLVSDSDYEDVYHDLCERLNQWMKRTNDPLLNGPVSKPKGAIANPQDALHPTTDTFEPPNAR